MTEYTRIEIDGQDVDLSNIGDLTGLLNITFVTQNTKDLQGLTGTSTEVPLKLPATSRNIFVFKQAGLLNSSEQPTRTSRKFEIFQGGALVQSGTCRLIRPSSLSDNHFQFKPNEYELAIYLDNLGFWDSVSQQKIADLGYAAIDWIESNISLGFNARNTPSENTQSGFTIVKQGVWFGGAQLTLEDFTPFLFVRNLFKKILSNVNGVAYSYQSRFIDSDFFGQLHIPITQLQYPDDGAKRVVGVVAELSSPFLYNIPNPAIPVVVPIDEVSDIGNDYDPVTGVFTARIEGSYRIRISATVSNSSADSICSITTIPAQTPIVTPNSFVQTTGAGDFNIELTRDVYLQQGDTASFVIGLASTPPPSLVGQVNTAFMTIEPLQIYANRENSVAKFEGLLNQSWTSLDLIKGLTHMFNLLWYVDNVTRTVYVEPKNPYCLEDGLGNLIKDGGFYEGEIDISELIDFSKESEIREIEDEEQFFQLGYKKANSDPTLEFLEQGGNLPALLSQYELQNFAKEGEVVESENPFFEQQLMVRDFNLFLSSDMNVSELAQMPCNYPQNVLPTDVGGEGDNANRTEIDKASILYFCPQKPYKPSFSAILRYEGANYNDLTGTWLNTGTVGSSANLTQGTPFRRPSSVSTPNGNSAVRFDGLQDIVLGSGFTANVGVNFSVSGLIKNSVAPSASQPVFRGSFNVNQYIIRGSQFFSNYTSPSDNKSVQAATTSQWATFSIVVSSSEIKLYVDSVLIDSESITSPWINPINGLNIGTFSIGNEFDVAEIVFEDKALGNGEVSIRNSFFRNKYLSTSPDVIAKANRVALPSDTPETRYAVPQSIVSFYDVGVDFTTPLNKNVNLSYSNITTVQQTTKVGLAKLFHARDFVTNDRGEILQAYAYFNNLDLLNFNYKNSRWRWQELTWYVREIKGFKPLEDVSTEFRIQKVVFPTSEDYDRILSSGVTAFTDINT